MKRRDFLAVAGTTAAWRLVAHAQGTDPTTVGFLGASTAEAWAEYTAIFSKRLSEAGYDDGRNVRVEYRWANGDYDRLPALAADLLRRHARVIVFATTPAAVAAKAATVSVPVVFVTIGDPVRLGLVTSLSRPGGNVTGITQLNVEMGPKLLEMLYKAIPTATAIALLLNPAGPNANTLSNEFRGAADTLGVQLHVLNVSTPDGIEKAFSSLAQLRAGGLVIGGDPFLNSHRDQIASLALRYRMPSIYQARLYPEAGGLMSYGGDGREAYSQAGAYAARILNGERPADLPVQQVTRIALVINLRTARALGLNLPQSLLAGADEVIE